MVRLELGKGLDPRSFCTHPAMVTDGDWAVKYRSPPVVPAVPFARQNHEAVGRIFGVRAVAGGLVVLLQEPLELGATLGSASASAVHEAKEREGAHACNRNALMTGNHESKVLAFSKTC